MTNTKTYNEKIKTLSFVLNNRINKNSIIEFKTNIKDLERENKTTLSTFFLRNLIKTNNSKKKENILRQFLKRGEVKTTFQNSYNESFDFIGNTIKDKAEFKFISL